MSNQEQGWVQAGTTFTPETIFRGPSSRRRISRGSMSVTGSEPGNPEELVDEQEELIQAAIEAQHMQAGDKGKYVVPVGEEAKATGKHKDRPYRVLDLQHLTKSGRQLVVDRAMKTEDQDNEEFLKRYAERVKRSGIEVPTVEVRFRDLQIGASVYLGDRALPTLTNSYRNIIEEQLIRFKLMRSNKKPFPILHGISGVLKPGCLTLLLGPPGAGKSTLLKALAGKLRSDRSLRQFGSVLYNGEGFKEFFPERTAAYVDQVDNHIPDMTVRETFDFAARVQGSGSKADFLRRLAEKEHEHGIAYDRDVDAFLQACTVEGKASHPLTNFFLRILGLEVCQDTFVGDNFVRGISGGQKKRVTTGEMCVGPKNVFFLDEISTGLDSSTTFLIVKAIRNMVHMAQATCLMALLQPAPEVFDVFDDVLLLCDGHVVYHGPRESCMDFFNQQGFELPARKGVADFLQEVTSMKDQKQYWARSQPWSYQPVSVFAEAFAMTEQGQRNEAAHDEPHYTAAKEAGLDPLARKKYALGMKDLFVALLSRDLLLLKRHSFVYIFRTMQVAVVAVFVATLFIRPTMPRNNLSDANKYAGMIFFSLLNMFFDGFTEMALTVDSLPMMYKQRDDYFYPAWAFFVPATFLRLPYSLTEAVVWTCITYYVVGLAPDAGRFFGFMVSLFLCHQLAVCLFRCMAAIGRTLVVAYTIAWLLFLLFILLGGYVLTKGSVPVWYIGGYWTLPLGWLTNSILINEFSAPRWQTPYIYDPSQTLGQAWVTSFQIKSNRVWEWLGWAYTICWLVGLNILTVFFLSVLSPLDKQSAVMEEEQLQERELGIHGNADSRKTPQPIIEGDENDVEANGTDMDGVTQGKSKQQVEEAKSRHSLDTGAASPRGKSRRMFGGSRHSMRSNGSDDSRPSVDASRRRSMGKSRRYSGSIKRRVTKEGEEQKGMVLPFEPFSLCWQHIYYSVDVPAGSDVKGDQVEGCAKPQLTLLRDISGAFRPGRLTTLMGSSGAGKTTLMDVLAGRKTTGTIRGDIWVNGHPKVQDTFKRVCGYVEQFDIHSPALTIRESLVFSAETRLLIEDQNQLQEFVDEVLALMELDSIRGALVGIPGRTGLSVEQRKRLTIGVELVSNPSVIFMDEPTSGLDARAAAVVMRTVRAIVSTGRTICCTIHQPSIDIFEAFDELLLLKRGGRVIYNGPTGRDSCDLVTYFQHIQGVPKIEEGINPATWMLEVTNLGSETRLGVDFADIYQGADLDREVEDMVEELKKPKEGSQALHFDTAYSRSYFQQFRWILWKNNITYWRLPQYNGVRMFFTVVFGLLVGSIYWRHGDERTSSQGISNVLGALLVAAIFLGTNNASTVQPVVDTERTVFFRERSAGCYAPYPFALAQILVEVPYLLVQTIMYSCITYYMAYFYIDAGKFFWYTLFMLLTLTFFTQYGMCAVSFTPNNQMAAVVSSAAYGVWFLFAGFILPKPRLPQWWSWMYYLDPLTWTIYGMISSQLSDSTDMIALEDGRRVTVSTYVFETYNYRHKYEGYCVLILCAMIVVGHVITAFCLAKLNFLKR